MDIYPIRTEADYRRSLAELATLMDAEMGSPDGDHLDVLATLIEAYEATHMPIEAPDPIEAILFMMEQKQLSRRDLEPAIGSRARVADVLIQPYLTRAPARITSPPKTLPAAARQSP